MFWNKYIKSGSLKKLAKIWKCLIDKEKGKMVMVQNKIGGLNI